MSLSTAFDDLDSTATVGAQTTATTADSYMFIIGHVGAPKQETHIGCSANPGEAIRQYNNSLRGTHPGIVCVCIYVPGWRRLAVTELVQLWHRSRKLYCRMRFGIMMAYDLGLPCYVSPLALRNEAARKAMPHIVARLATDHRAQLLLGDASEFKRVAARRRGRRPSTYDSAVAESIVFGDLSTDNISATIAASDVRLRASQPPIGMIPAQLDRRNTLARQNATVCFTIGMCGRLSKRTDGGAKSRKRKSRGRDANVDDDSNFSSALASPLAVSDEENDDDDDNDEEEAENDDTSLDSSVALPKPRKAKRKTLNTEQLMIELEPVRQRAAREVDLYKTSHPTLALASTSTTAVDAARAAAAACSIDGVIDNRLLAERADSLFTDANEFIERHVSSVRVDRAQHCVCGARGSFDKRGVCGECHRTSRSTRVVRTSLVALRERATGEKCTRQDRHELRRLLINAERETPIDVYGRTTAQQMREIVAQQSHPVGLSSPTALRRSPTKQRVPKEMSIINEALKRAYAKK